MKLRPGYGLPGLFSCPGGAHAGPYQPGIQSACVVSLATPADARVVGRRASKEGEVPSTVLGQERCGHSSVLLVAALSRQARRRHGGWRPTDLTPFSCCPSSARGWVCLCAAMNRGGQSPSPPLSPKCTGCPRVGRRPAGGAPPAEGMCEHTLPHSCGKFPAGCRPPGAVVSLASVNLAARDHPVRLRGLCAVPPFVCALMAFGRVGW